MTARAPKSNEKSLCGSLTSTDMGSEGSVHRKSWCGEEGVHFVHFYSAMSTGGDVRGISTDHPLARQTVGHPCGKEV